MYIFCQGFVDCIVAATMETMITEAQREPVGRRLSPPCVATVVVMMEGWYDHFALLSFSEGET